MAVASPGTLTTAPAAPCCPKCGFLADPPLFEDFRESQAVLANANKQIADLEAQVRLLNQKASAAVDRWADYEDEISKLRAQLEARPQTPAAQSSPTKQQQQQQHHASLPTPPSSAAGLPTPSPSRASFLTTSAATRISASSPANPLHHPHPIPSLPSSFTYPPDPPSTGNPTATTTQTHTHPHSPLSPPPSLPTSAQLTTEDLLSALSREQALRRQAEGRLHDTSREVEELSVSLFEQANEMVAAERRARAQLEARVGELERREGDKRRRLERLERAVGRIERVRGVLGEMDGNAGSGGLGGRG
ncbi:hypothetical protein NEMBOFW57_005990 [Staphylotrichum longicolle]|uniref:GDP/GTP exchange factor Sec2 N-terminal domain-containing protein n=1 Tax=Staphylotrichum longicolle TaxID=669026 RepID=A0AAD4EY20_9PEZI|nr:hypothetical protein NEMBOFW57_005990 [Staphylotrichum longicolle]